MGLQRVVGEAIEYIERVVDNRPLLMSFFPRPSQRDHSECDSTRIAPGGHVSDVPVTRAFLTPLGWFKLLATQFQQDYNYTGV